MFPEDRVTADSRLRLKHEEIVAKVLDGEVVIIDLSNGAYYVSKGTGGTIWSLIEDGLCMEEIAAEVAARYDVSPARAQEDVLRLAADLVHAGVLAAASQGASTRPSPQREAAERLPYETPQLRAFHDMEELLALDPPSPSLTDIPWKE